MSTITDDSQTTPVPGLSRGAIKAPRAYIETYGCQMNRNDTGLLGGILRGAGCRLVDSPYDADIILLNTCAVRENAEQRIIGRVGQLSQLKAQRRVRIGVLGCMAQHLKEKMWKAVPQVDFIMGPDAYRRLPDVLDLSEGQRSALCQMDCSELYEGLPRVLAEGEPSAYVTIMRGCDRMCTFCIVPFTRGRERSRAWPAIVAEVEELVARGVKEVTLLGQTVNAYADGEITFGRLLWKVAETGISRIRFTSPHPLYYREDELEAIAGCARVCEWVHLPLQAGSNRVLERMNRGYTKEAFLDLVARIRNRVPAVTLTTDIIVGFPGETEAQFEETLEVMKRSAFDSSYMFKYSPRPGTRAARDFPDDVSEEVKQRRLERVISLQTELTQRANEAMVGKRYEVLISEPGRRGPDQWVGRTRGNKVVVVESKELRPGDIAGVTIYDTGAWTLRGRLA